MKRKAEQVTAHQFALLVRFNPDEVELDNAQGRYYVTTGSGKTYWTPFGDEAAAVVGGAA